MLRRPALLATALLACAAAGPAAEHAAPHILEATPEYCRSLARRLAVLPAARMEPSRSLGADGVRLCTDGHLRTGVNKLRRALRAAQEHDGPASTAGTSVEMRGATR